MAVIHHTTLEHTTLTQVARVLHASNVAQRTRQRSTSWSVLAVGVVVGTDATQEASGRAEAGLGGRLGCSGLEIGRNPWGSQLLSYFHESLVIIPAQTHVLNSNAGFGGIRVRVNEANQLLHVHAVGESDAGGGIGEGVTIDRAANGVDPRSCTHCRRARGRVIREAGVAFGLGARAADAGAASTFRAEHGACLRDRGNRGDRGDFGAAQRADLFHRTGETRDIEHGSLDRLQTDPSTVNWCVRAHARRLGTRNVCVVGRDT